MSKHDRGDDSAILAFAVICSLIIFAMIGYFQGLKVGQARDEEVYAAKHQQDADTYIESACAGLDISAITKCVDVAEKSRIEQRRAEYSLRLQQQSTVWAEWTLYITGLSMIIGATGIWFVWRTLDHTAKAVETANEANFISRMEQRPWVTVRWRVPCQFTITQDGNKYKINWLFDFENLGKSPAFHVRHEWGIYRLDEGLVGVGQVGVDDLLSKAKRNIMGFSPTPIIFPSEKTEHIWPIEGLGAIAGHPKGSIFLCSCLTYALDSSNRSFGIEARAYGIEKMEVPEGDMTHNILRIPGYDRIDTWIARKR